MRSLPRAHLPIRACRLVGRPIRALFPLSPFPADASKFSQQDLLSPKFLLGAQMAITFCEAGLVPALQTQATGWNNHCTIVTQRLRLFKTVQVRTLVEVTAWALFVG